MFYYSKFTIVEPYSCFSVKTQDNTRYFTVKITVNYYFLIELRYKSFYFNSDFPQRINVVFTVKFIVILTIEKHGTQ